MTSSDTRYAWYAVAILTLANVSSFVDRQILTLLVDPIRRDLAISDTEMSLLLGLSFALFYTVLGFPIARLADRRSRRGIIAVGIVVVGFGGVGHAADRGRPRGVKKDGIVYRDGRAVV